MSKSICLAAASVLLACTSTQAGVHAHGAAAEKVPAQPLKSLRGFEIGAQCRDQHQAFLDLRREGFVISSTKDICERDAGSYRSEIVLLEQDGKKELVEVAFAPDSTIWKVKVTLSWEGFHTLAENPAITDIDASLRSRFGEPAQAAYNDQASGDSAWTVHRFTWAEKEHVDAMASWKRIPGVWESTLKGLTVRAMLRASQTSSRKDLVVEAVNNWVVPYAAKAQEKARERAQAEAKDRSISVLRGL